MKKIIFNLMLVITLLLNVSLATDYSEYIEYSSGEVDDGSIYLDSYEDYLNAIQGVDEQELYKSEYLANIENAKQVFESTKPEEIIKAKVISGEETEEYYAYDSYGAYKIKYQPLTLEILEGEHKGETYETTYILTADSYENLKVKEVKENQKINVVIQEEDGEVYVYATTIDASVVRINYLIILVVIMLALMLIYLGKKTLKILPQLIIIADIVLLVFVPEMINGTSVIWLSIVTIILYVITNTVIKVGLNAKTFPAMLSTASVLVITAIGLIIFNNISTMTGIIYEITSLIESFPNGTINFANLVLSMYMLMSTIVVSDISCKVLNDYQDSEKESTRATLKEYVSEKILATSGILFITIIPKYMYMIIAKYSFKEIINSEMLINEIARIIFIAIAMLITTEVSIIVKKLFVEEKEK